MQREGAASVVLKSPRTQGMTQGLDLACSTGLIRASPSAPDRIVIAAPVPRSFAHPCSHMVDQWMRLALYSLSFVVLGFWDSVSFVTPQHSHSSPGSGPHPTRKLIPKLYFIKFYTSKIIYPLSSSVCHWRCCVIHTFIPPHSAFLI